MDNLVQASRVPLAITCLGAFAMAAWAIARQTFWFPAHNVWLFLLYPIWAIAQQYLALGVLTLNLAERTKGPARQALVVLLVATIFGLLHWPDRPVMIATFFLELLVVPLFLRTPNLWPLGAMHGWLGAMFYCWVLGRDLFSENFLK
jgi:hypothetical protein